MIVLWSIANGRDRDSHIASLECFIGLLCSSRSKARVKAKPVWISNFVISDLATSVSGTRQVYKTKLRVLNFGTCNFGTRKTMMMVLQIENILRASGLVS